MILFGFRPPEVVENRPAKAATLKVLTTELNTAVLNDEHIIVSKLIDFGFNSIITPELKVVALDAINLPFALALG